MINDMFIEQKNDEYEYPVMATQEDIDRLQGGDKRSSRITGITIKLDGDATGLNKALDGIEKNLKSTQRSLSDVNKLLKLDPKNTTLLEQKQKLLAKSIEETETKLKTLRTASDQAAESVKKYDAWKQAYDPIQKEIDQTREKIDELKKNMSEMKDAGEVDTDEYKKLETELADSTKKLQNLRKEAQKVNDTFGNPISPEQFDALQRLSLIHI